MPIWEFAISIKDEPEEQRKKEGDVISFKPYPWIDWGKLGEKHYLIVLVDGLLKEEAIKLTTPRYNLNIDNVLEQSEMDELGTYTIAKRRYKLPFDIIKDGWCPDLDIAKVQDPEVRYQPFKNSEIIIDTREHVSIFYDKVRESFKYRARKKL